MRDWQAEEPVITSVPKSHSLFDLHPAWPLPQHISDGVDEPTPVTHASPFPGEGDGTSSESMGGTCNQG